MESASNGSTGNEELPKAIAALERAIQLRPGFTDAEKALGYGYLLNNQIEKGRDMLRRAIADDPSDENTTLLLAQAELRLNRFNEARSLLGPIVGRSQDPRIKEQARDLLGRSVGLEQRQQILGEAKAAEPRQEAQSNVEPVGPARPAAPNGPVGPSVRPDFRTTQPGETRTYGMFVSVVCAQSEVVLEVRAPGRTFLLRAARFDAVDFISYRRVSPGSISCGPRTPPEEVYVTWRANPSSAGNGNAQGTVVAVELLPEGFVPAP